jgi:hypothetical protein
MSAKNQFISVYSGYIDSAMEFFRDKPLGMNMVTVLTAAKAKILAMRDLDETQN